jgi:hypothetical protein
MIVMRGNGETGRELVSVCGVIAKIERRRTERKAGAHSIFVKVNGHFDPVTRGQSLDAMNPSKDRINLKGQHVGGDWLS